MKNYLIKSILILGCIVLAVIIFNELIIYKKNKPLCENCNILLISLDTLAAKHLPCYGYDKDTSPNLCQFGKNNILFSNSYSQSFWTRPSQTSVLTGLHPTTHGVRVSYADKLLPKFKTLAEILKEYGYTTYYFGPSIDNRSWDESVIRGFDYMRQDIYESASLGHWQKALDILEENQKSKTPTFMFLHTYYVHAPYATGSENLKFVNKEDVKKYSKIPLTDKDLYSYKPEMGQYIVKSLEDRVKSSRTEESLKINKEMLNNFNMAKTFNEKKITYDNFPNREIYSFSSNWYYKTIRELDASEYFKSLYDEKINQLDTELKSFLDRLKGKFMKDTIVIIYSDHGDTHGERGIYGHCEDNADCLYMETVKVPLIIRVPGLKSKKIDELAQGIDIYPTIMKLIGKEGPSNLEGEDLVGLMTGSQKKSKKDYVISETEVSKFVIIDRKWSLYTKDLYSLNPNQVELFDLENDKNQLVNLVGKYPNVVTEKMGILKEYMRRPEKNIKSEYDFPEWIDEIKKEKLKKGGYF